MQSQGANNQNGGGSGNSGGGQQGGQNGGQNNPMMQMADELLQLKALADKLELEMTQYVSVQTGGQVTEKDVANLMLTMISSMVDWTVDYVSTRQQGAFSSANNAGGNVNATPLQ